MHCIMPPEYKALWMDMEYIYLPSAPYGPRLLRLEEGFPVEETGWAEEKDVTNSGVDY